MKVWGALKSLNRNPRLAGPIANRRGSEEFYEALFGKCSVTLTGRVRTKATYNRCDVLTVTLPDAVVMGFEERNNSTIAASIRCSPG